MDEQEHKPDERLEPMLRRWGADEAIRKAQVGPCPLPKTERQARKGGLGVILLRWCPPAAAAAMLVVAVVLFVLAGPKYATRQAERPSAAAQRAESAPAGVGPTTREGSPAEMQKRLEIAEAQIERLSEQLKTTAVKLAKAEAELAAASQQPKDVTEAVAKALAGREKELREEFDEQRAALKREIDPLNEQKKAAGVKLAVAEGRIKELEAKLATERTTARDELARQRKMHTDALAALGKAQADLAGLKAQLDDFPRIYLASVAPGAEGLAARQQAARTVRIVSRSAMLRPSASQSATGKLLDSVEVVFTQLDIIDPYDPQAAAGFARLVTRSDLKRRIDAILADGSEGPHVRALLFEAKLILTGAESAG